MNRLLIAGILLAAGLLTAAPPAAAAGPDDPAGTDEVLDAVAGTVPTRYVILLDTSGSMARDGLYPRARTAVEDFVTALAPDDSVAVIPFDEGPGSTCRAEAGSDRLRGCVPATARRHQDTDLGAALRAGITEIAGRPSAASVLILVSDGQHDPPAGSEYGVPASGKRPEWAALRERAGRLDGVTAWALPLRGLSGITALNVVFPQANTLTVRGGDRIREQLREAVEPQRRINARTALAVDAHPVVRAAWAGAGPRGLTVDGPSGTARIELRLTSGARHVPLTVTFRGLRADGLRISADLPGPVTLAPGTGTAVPVDLHWDPPPRQGTWQRTSARTSTIEMTTEVTSPWDRALTALEIPVAPTVRDPAPLDLRLEDDEELGAAAWFTLAALLLTAAAGIVAFLLYRNPPPAGHFTTRRLDLPVPSGASDRTGTESGTGDGLVRPWSLRTFWARRTFTMVDAREGGRVRVRSIRARVSGAGRAQPVFVVRYSPAAEKGQAPHSDRAYCLPGGSVLVCGLLFVHRPDDRGRPGDAGGPGRNERPRPAGPVPWEDAR